DRREAHSQKAAPPMAHGCHDQPPGDRGARRAPGHTQKEKTMIFHINRIAFKPGVSDEQREAGLELMRQSGANPVVKSYVVGPELGGEFEYGAVYVVEDLDGYWAYLEFPAHVRLELWGIPYLEKFAAIDVSDSEDPEFGAKVAALQARHQQEHPEIAAEIAQAASFTVPDRARQPAGRRGPRSCHVAPQRGPARLPRPGRPVRPQARAAGGRRPVLPLRRRVLALGLVHPGGDRPRTPAAAALAARAAEHHDHPG